MFGEDEHTLYKPAGAAAPTPRGEAQSSGGYRQPAPSMLAAAEEEENRGSLGDLLKYSINASKRRKLLSFFVVVVGSALTVAAVRFAPRTYQSTGEVLIISGQDEGAGGWVMENKRQQLEWEKQVRSRETIDGIIRDAELVEQWDDMRQPHRVLLDEAQTKMGTPKPTAEQKFGALEGMLEASLRLLIDQSTVSIQCDWPNAEAARDIVQAALSRFIDKRYQTEVGTILTRIKPLEDQLETARQTLEQIDPSLAPPKEAPTEATPAEQLVAVSKQPSQESIEAGQRLPAARERQATAAQRLAELEAQRQGRLNHLRQQKAGLAATLGASHPEMIAIDFQIKDAQKDSPELVEARARKSAADADVAELAGKAGVAVPKSRPHTNTATPAKRLTELELQRIGAAREEYNRKKDALDAENIKLRTAEAAFKSKYQITRPPEAPLKPKKPIELMVGLGGALATLMAMLALATLRDRSAGIFFESKQVRDRLRLPVLGDVRAADIAS